MGNQGQFLISPSTLGEKIIHVDRSINVPPGNVAVRVAMPKGSSVGIKLPRAEDAVGCFVSVFVEDDGDEATVTIIDPSGGTEILMTGVDGITLNGAYDYSYMYSDGLKWWELVSYHM